MKIKSNLLPVISSSLDCYNCTHTSCFVKHFIDTNIDDFNKVINKGYNIKAGTTLCVEKCIFHNLYVVRSGLLKDCLYTRDGKEKIIDFYFAGDVIGLDAINEGRYLATTIAVQPSQICAIPFNESIMLMIKVPALIHNLSRLISQKLCNRTRSWCDNHSSAEQRVASFLIKIGERQKHNGYSTINYHLPMTRYDMSSYLNLTPETVSRVFTKLQQEGMLCVNKQHVQIINLPELLQRYF